MDKKRRCGSLQSNSNAGFSIVELIICVSILAIAAIPLMKSMGLATNINSKAQSVQNATSLGEKIMEEIKSTSIADLHTKYGGGFNDDGKYIINLGSQQATQGETFDVVVTIDKKEYMDETADDLLNTPDDNVKAANKTRLPDIEEIDTLSQAVLSSTKEFNKYDSEALNYFNQKLANYPTDKATITSKTIDIVKTAVAYPPGVRVQATVTYEDDATNESGDPAPNRYVRDLYTGTFVPVNKEGSTTEYKPLDSNIYIFYKKNEDTNIIPSTLQEVINITDSAGTTNPSDPMDSHRVYFVRQKLADVTGPKLTLNGESFTYSNIDTLTEGEKTFDGGKIDLITNLGSSVSATDGHIYKTKAKIRVYGITVELKKGSEVISTLNSTVRANDNESELPVAGP